MREKHLDSPAPDRPIMHAPWPGPMYWDWRCRICSEPVIDHAPWWLRIWHKLTAST